VGETVGSVDRHTWDDVIDETTRQLYRAYDRPRQVGTRPVVLAIDLYNLAFDGGPREVSELMMTHPSSCGRHAWDAVAPISSLLAIARARSIPIVYTTNEAPRAGERSAPTLRQGPAPTPRDYEIRSEFAPQPRDLVIRKQRASAFFGTALVTHLISASANTVIVCGETTSGCVRASVVDAYSNGFGVVVAEECCFDRSQISHKVNLFDMHHKYADVMHLDEIGRQLSALPRVS